MLFQILTILVIQTALFALLFYISGKYKLIYDEPSNQVRKIHQKKMIVSGGVSFLAIYGFFIFYDSYEFFLLLNFSTIFLLIGFLSDIKPRFSPALRIFLVIIFSVTYFILSQDYITFIDINLFGFDKILNITFLFFFSVVAMLLLINGTNLIDGLHGLKTAAMITIIIVLLLRLESGSSDLIYFLNFLLLILFYFYIINFFISKIRSGDTGSYFIAFIIGAVAINVNNNGTIPSLYIGCILIYPILEVTYTYLRRIINKTNPFYPDQEHLHSLLYMFFLNKYPDSRISGDNINRISSLIISTAHVIYQIIIFQIPSDNNLYYIYSLLILILIYMSTMIFLKRSIKKNNNN